MKQFAIQFDVSKAGGIATDLRSIIESSDVALANAIRTNGSPRIGVRGMAFRLWSSVPDDKTAEALLGEIAAELAAHGWSIDEFSP